MGRRRDEEFAEFFGVAWTRVYRTTYAVSGRHDVTREAALDSFAHAYVEFAELSTSDDPGDDVEGWAVDAVLAAQGTGRGPDAFGPVVPYGALIRARTEARAEVEALWQELQQQSPELRAAIAWEAMAAARAPHQLQVIDLGSGVSPRLVDFLARHLEEIDVPEGDLAQVISLGRARQQRRRWVGLLVAALIVAMVAAPLLMWDRVSDDAAEVAPTPTTGTWEEIAPAPLSPRWSSLVSWTGDEVVVLGGHSEETCDDRGVCEALTDGAAYTPSTGQWRTLAPLPFGVADGTPSLQVGDTLVLVVAKRWWSYDAREDVWARLPSPPDFDPAGLNNAAATDTEVFVPGRGTADPIYAFNVAQSTWSVLPDSPLEPRLERRMLAATSAGLVVFGADSSGPPDDPFVFDQVYAQVFDGQEWSLLPSSEQRAAACCWWWTGERLVHLERMPIYGGKGGTEDLRFAGGMSFDVVTQEWDLIPEAPISRMASDSWQLSAVAGPMMAFDDAIYDDRYQLWTRITRPSQAPQGGAAAAWVDERLFAFGGANFDEGPSENTGATNRAWILTPPEPAED